MVENRSARLIEHGPRFGGWEVAQEKFSGLITHVVPQVDLLEHELTLDCWCLPSLEGGTVVHNSKDGREFFERGQRNPS